MTTPRNSPKLTRAILAGALAKHDLPLLGAQRLGDYLRALSPDVRELVVQATIAAQDNRISDCLAFCSEAHAVMVRRAA